MEMTSSSRSGYQHLYEEVAISDVEDNPAHSKSKWSDELWHCHRNLWPSCCCAFFCFDGIYLVAQVAQLLRIGESRWIFLTYAAIFAISIVCQQREALYFIGLAPFLYSLQLAVRLRLKVVNKLKVQSDGLLWEVLTGLCCHPCSVAQIARHLYRYRSVCSTAADLEGAVITSDDARLVAHRV